MLQRALLIAVVAGPASATEARAQVGDALCERQSGAALAQTARPGGDAPAPQPSREDQTPHTRGRHSCRCLEAEKVTSSAVFQSLHDLHDTDTCPGAPWSLQSTGQQLQRPAHGEPSMSTPQPPKCSAGHNQMGDGERCFTQQKYHSQFTVLMGPIIFVEPCLFPQLLIFRGSF